MAARKRIYDSILSEHLAKQRQMAFVSGPRQVGKTTTCGNFADKYLNWDNTSDRVQIIKGPAIIAELSGLTKLRKEIPTSK